MFIYLPLLICLDDIFRHVIIFINVDQILMCYGLAAYIANNVVYILQVILGSVLICASYPVKFLVVIVLYILYCVGVCLKILLLPVYFVLLVLTIPLRIIFFGIKLTVLLGIFILLCPTLIFHLFVNNCIPERQRSRIRRMEYF